ncbi:MAG: flavodoxin-dependent (E)-4-hydroxy-3-methylbut-2-enyl-diphosphate synthase [Clostridia bacterium]
MKTKKIAVGNIFIGGGSPITVQSMTNTDTRDVKNTVKQIKMLEEAGCEIIRVAVPDIEAAEAIKKIKKSISIPLVADIHFDYRLAIQSIMNGADKIRINPGNIGGADRVKSVIAEAKDRNITIRIGVNSGSLEKNILKRYNGVTPEGMVESALNNMKILEAQKFTNTVVSLKTSNVLMTINSYRLMSQKSDYPLHIGVTEAGTVKKGTVKSSVGIGCLLAEGIGDTIRVSLTGDPIEEVITGKEILKALGLKNEGIEFISCPTCGRCRINLVEIAEEAEKRLAHIKTNIKVAIMGCAVNGPGEAIEADIGLAGGDKEVLLFKKGVILEKIKEENAVDVLVEEIEKMNR